MEMFVLFFFFKNFESFLKKISKKNQVYDGEFADGLRNGRGTYAFSSGDSVYEGVFEKGNMKSGVWKMGDGVSYEGNYEDNFPQDESGDASFTFPRQQDFPAVGKMSDGFFQTNYF